MDYFAPILKRILAATTEFQALTQATQDILREGDTASADIEQFMTDLELAHKANMKAYESGVKLSSDHDRLEIELNRLRGMPAATEKLADAGSAAMMMRDVISQNYIDAALKIGMLDATLYYLMFKELSSYDEWKAKGPQLLEALNRVMEDKL